MTVRKTQQVADNYAVEDALFTRTMRYMANQSTPNVWRPTARRSVLARLKHALLGYSNVSSKHQIQVKRHTSTDPVSVARWFI